MYLPIWIFRKLHPLHSIKWKDVIMNFYEGKLNEEF